MAFPIGKAMMPKKDAMSRVLAEGAIFDWKGAFERKFP